MDKLASIIIFGSFVISFGTYVQKIQKKFLEAEQIYKEGHKLWQMKK